jgi:ribonuclease BN (tRNA processing enzyme)
MFIRKLVVDGLGPSRSTLLLGKTLLLLLLSTAATVQAQSSCSSDGTVLQILGSGGPFGSNRASSGYLVWIEGRSRVMVDAGGGTFVRFNEAGAELADLQLLALSHFHPDHSAELPALLWPRNGSLRLAGPSGGNGFPSLEQYLDGLFGPAGVYPILNQMIQFETTTVDVNAGESEVLREGSLQVRARGVPHGNVPALAYRVDVGDVSIAFSSDQNGSDPAFIEFVRDVDILVVHFAGNEDGSGRADLHARPSTWGSIATRANVGRLVLSHLMSSQNLEENMGFLRQAWSGPLTIGADLLCLPVP